MKLYTMSKYYLVCYYNKLEVSYVRGTVIKAKTTLEKHIAM